MVEDNFLSAHGINRRDFMKLCAGMAATLGLSQNAVAKMATALRAIAVWAGVAGTCKVMVPRMGSPLTPTPASGN